MQLVLASGSAYRQALLQRLRLDFVIMAPEIDETPRPGETAEQVARRLAQAKALAVATRYTNALIIGSDQVAVCEGRLLGKPGDRTQAAAQLAASSGKRVRFHTGLCLYHSASGRCQLECIPFAIQMRQLSAAQIERYLELDQPFDCAGSFRWERLGIALFAGMAGEDVTSLEGLPLIRLIDMLAREGIDVL